MAVVESSQASSTAIAPKFCRWCFTTTIGERQTYCSKLCRQSAWRLKRRRSTDDISPFAPGQPSGLVFAYADPPYPGMSRRYYGSPEVDHRELISQVIGGHYAGWALSTSAATLREILPLCPLGARICAWVKPIGASPRTYGPHNTWEPLIIWGGRVRRLSIRDWLSAQPARGNGDLVGRKPIAFCAWLFDCLGMVTGDRLVDLFPGSGIVSHAWENLGGVAECPGDFLQDPGVVPRGTTPP